MLAYFVQLHFFFLTYHELFKENCKYNVINSEMWQVKIIFKFGVFSCLNFVCIFPSVSYLFHLY